MPACGAFVAWRVRFEVVMASLLSAGRGFVWPTRERFPRHTASSDLAAELVRICFIALEVVLFLHWTLQQLLSWIGGCIILSDPVREHGARALRQVQRWLYPWRTVQRYWQVWPYAQTHSHPLYLSLRL
jgi:hypothetical protein